MNKLFSLILLGILSFTSFAKELPSKPNPPRLVNDFSGVLNQTEVASLEAKLLTYSDSTSTQISIVLENSLDGDEIFDYSHRLAENWGIGTKGKNNGLLIYVAVKERKIRIQTGYGMEATITDALSKRIIEENIKPNFRQNNYYLGLDEATSILMRAAAGEYINDSPRKNSKKSPPPFLVLIIIIVIILIIITSNKGGGGRGRGLHGPGPFFGTFGGGGFSSGGFGGGSSGGGGFGGFGGGSFGGGGAGGSW